MGRNLPAGIQVVTEYEAAWGRYLPVLATADQALLEDLFTRLRLESPRLDAADSPDPFALYAMLLLADVVKHTSHAVIGSSSERGKPRE